MAELTLEQCATLACLLEVAAPKPGNVHRAADFEDMTLSDFMASAVAIGPIFQRAAQQRVGTTVLEAIRATRKVTRANTNLGILLLLAPLAAVPRGEAIEAGVERVLGNLSAEDASDVYQALREVSPGGLKPVDREVAEHDVHDAPPSDLRAAMRLAADWDLVARQYANGFQEVLQTVRPWLMENASQFPLSLRIVHTHVRLMNAYPDSLIARKCGEETAREAATYAGSVLSCGPPDSDEFADAVGDLDFWCRSDGNRRNPGTSADLIAAALFVLLREGTLQPPFG